MVTHWSNNETQEDHMATTAVSVIKHHHIEAATVLTRTITPLTSMNISTAHTVTVRGTTTTPVAHYSTTRPSTRPTSSPPPRTRILTMNMPTWWPALPGVLAAATQRGACGTSTLVHCNTSCATKTTSRASCLSTVPASNSGTIGWSQLRAMVQSLQLSLLMATTLSYASTTSCSCHHWPRISSHPVDSWSKATICLLMLTVLVSLLDAMVLLCSLHITAMACSSLPCMYVNMLSVWPVPLLQSHFMPCIITSVTSARTIFSRWHAQQLTCAACASLMT